MDIAIIGAGRISEIHSENLSKIKDVNIKYYYDPDPNISQKIASKYGASDVNLKQILEDSSIEAVFILSPTSFHYEQIKLFASKRINIFCEKPIDLSLDRTVEIVELVRSTNIKFMLGFNRRFDPQFIKLNEAISNGLVGDIHQLVITSRDPNPPNFQYLEKSGGIFRDMMIHDFDMANWLLKDEIIDLSSYGSRLIDSSLAAIKDYDTADVMLKTKSGAICHIINSRKAVYGYDQRIEVFGSKGMIQALNNTETNLVLSSSKSIELEKPMYFFLERYKQAFESEINHFIHCIKNDINPSVSAEDGYKALALAELAIKKIHNLN